MERRTPWKVERETEISYWGLKRGSEWESVKFILLVHSPTLASPSAPCILYDRFQASTAVVFHLQLFTGRVGTASHVHQWDDTPLLLKSYQRAMLTQNARECLERCLFIKSRVPAIY